MIQILKTLILFGTLLLAPLGQTNATTILKPHEIKSKEIQKIVKFAQKTDLKNVANEIVLFAPSETNHSAQIKNRTRGLLSQLTAPQVTRVVSSVANKKNHTLHNGLYASLVEINSSDDTGSDALEEILNIINESNHLYAAGIHFVGRDKYYGIDTDYLGFAVVDTRTGEAYIRVIADYPQQDNQDDYYFDDQF